MPLAFGKAFGPTILVPPPVDGARLIARTAFLPLSPAGGLITYEVATRTTRVNAAALAIFGLDASFAELPLEARLAVIQPRHADGTLYRAEETPFRRALRGETVREAVVQMRAADGRVLWICTAAAPVRLGGEITGVIQTLRDVTEQRRTEEARRRAEAELQAIFETSPDFMGVKDRRGRIQRANAAIIEMMGRPLDQIIGRSPPELHTDPEIGAAIAASDQRIMASGQTEVVEEPVRYRDQTHLFLTTKIPYRDAEGKVIGLLVISRDITEQKRAEHALRASEARFRMLFEKAGEAIVIVATEGSEAGTFLHANAAAAAMYGYTPEEMRGMHYSRVMSPEGLAHATATMREVTTSCAALQRIRVRKDGTLATLGGTREPPCGRINISVDPQSDDSFNYRFSYILPVLEIPLESYKSLRIQLSVV